MFFVIPIDPFWSLYVTLFKNCTTLRTLQVCTHYSSKSVCFELFKRLGINNLTQRKNYEINLKKQLYAFSEQVVLKNCWWARPDLNW
jgi:hypothetical protein